MVAKNETASAICRGKNLTMETVCAFINAIPKDVMAKELFNSYAERRLVGWTQTHSQIARQMALYYEKDGLCYPRFRSKAKIEDIFAYVQKWAKLYYIPNPYTPSLVGNNKYPTNIYAFLKKCIQEGKENFIESCTEIFNLELNNTDKVRVYLNNFTDIVISDDIMKLNDGLADTDFDIEIHPNIFSNDYQDYYDYFGGEFSSSVSDFVQHKNLVFDINDLTKYRIFISAIKSKPFILLAGISGTGKSRIVRQLAYATGGENPDKVQKPYNYEIIQVRPNWHDSTELLGYETRISGETEYIVTDFLRFLAKAWYFEDVPFFLCLDEMNLAPVEQYFAEYLSVLETRKLRNGKIVSDALLPPLNGYGKKRSGSGSWVGDTILDDLFGKDWKVDNRSVEKDKEKEARLRERFRTEGIMLPPNLIVMGTVNMDETTFSFSRKVLDRAMTIEMNDVNFSKGVTKDECCLAPIAAEIILPDAVEAMDVYEANRSICDIVIAYLNEINTVLESSPFKVAYRTRNEFILYVLANLQYEGEDVCYKLIRALDEMTLMKVLSRIEGDKNKLMNLKQTGCLLDDLIARIKVLLEKVYQDFDAPEGEKSMYANWEEDAVSLCKLKEMKRKLDNTYYCSFWS